MGRYAHHLAGVAGRGEAEPPRLPAVRQVRARLQGRRERLRAPLQPGVPGRVVGGGGLRRPLLRYHRAHLAAARPPARRPPTGPRRRGRPTGASRRSSRRAVSCWSV
ncbi:hypothetical protein AMK21_17145 [Streptomyces sp. CB00316]|nr:hypothetical protein AMK21_17145 [Streptomyces sp. CB00316]